MLGVVLDERLSWRHHIAQTCSTIHMYCTLGVPQRYFPISLQANNGFCLNLLPYFSMDFSSDNYVKKLSFERTKE